MEEYLPQELQNQTSPTTTTSHPPRTNPPNNEHNDDEEEEEEEGEDLGDGVGYFIDPSIFHQLGASMVSSHQTTTAAHKHRQRNQSGDQEVSSDDDDEDDEAWDEVRGRFKCLVCLEVLAFPVITSCCGSNLCKGCVTEMVYQDSIRGVDISSCPHCREELNHKKCVFNRDYDRVICEEVMKCGERLGSRREWERRRESGEELHTAQRERIERRKKNRRSRLEELLIESEKEEDQSGDDDQFEDGEEDDDNGGFLDFPLFSYFQDQAYHWGKILLAVERLVGSAYSVLAEYFGSSEAGSGVLFVASSLTISMIYAILLKSGGGGGNASSSISRVLSSPSNFLFS